MRGSACKSIMRVKEHLPNWTRVASVRAKLLLVVLIGLISVAGNCPPPRGRQPNFFPRIRALPMPDQPPTSGLLLWLEGGRSYLRHRVEGGESVPAEPGHTVYSWRDVRWTPDTHGLYPTAFNSGFFEGSDRFEGQVVDVTLTGADTVTRAVRALRCGTPNDANTAVRCSYLILRALPTRLNGIDYTILAVVRRISGRGSNYFIMTDAGGSCSLAGGTGCAANSALHLGWAGETTARLGQYYNDSDLEAVPSFNSNSPPVSLFVARVGAMGKQVAVLEPGFNFFNTASDTQHLANSGSLFVGGTPWGTRVGVPDWRFVGDIFAVLVYFGEMDEGDMLMAQAYLRGKYGPE
jgi:hypothetical protein